MFLSILFDFISLIFANLSAWAAATLFLSHEWEQQSEHFGPAALAKYLHKQEETSTLYMFIFQNDWFATTMLHYLQKGQYLPQPKNSFWWQVFWQDHALYNKVLNIEGHPHTNKGFDAGYVEAST